MFINGLNTNLTFSYFHYTLITSLQTPFSLFQGPNGRDLKKTSLQDQNPEKQTKSKTESLRRRTTETRKTAYFVLSNNTSSQNKTQLEEKSSDQNEIKLKQYCINIQVANNSNQRLSRVEDPVYAVSKPHVGR